MDLQKGKIGPREPEYRVLRETRRDVGGGKSAMRIWILMPTRLYLAWEVQVFVLTARVRAELSLIVQHS